MLEHRLFLLTLLVVAFLERSPDMAAKLPARESGNDLAIGNNYLELRFQRKGDQLVLLCSVYIDSLVTRR